MVLIFVFSFALCVLLTGLVKRLAERFGFLDRPAGEEKKHHTRPVPLLGGIAIFLTIAIVTTIVLLTSNALTFGLMNNAHFIGFLLGGFVLMIGGALDDRFALPARFTIWFPTLAALIAVAFGIGVAKLSNPFGEPIELSALGSGILTFSWLLIVMYTTKFLDGLDGLATGVSAIGVLFMTLLALTATYLQLDAALFGALCLGALLGFLVWNHHPAKIFLGEGGSTFVGYTLGVMAVIAGSKFGTALLVLSIPFLDVLWVIGRRIFVEHRSPTRGDRKHLHHRLLDMDFSHRGIVFLYYALAAAAGTAGLFLQSQQKVFAFIALALLMIICAVMIVGASRRVGFVVGVVAAVLIFTYLFVFGRVGESGQALTKRMLSFDQGPTLSVEIADELSEQVIGLSFRDALAPDHGMLFVYPQKDQRLFWMKDMKFAIDIVWIADGTVVGIDANVQPPSNANETPKIYPSPTAVDEALEVPAGYMQAHSLTVRARLK